MANIKDFKHLIHKKVKVETILGPFVGYWSDWLTENDDVDEESILIDTDKGEIYEIIWNEIVDIKEIK